MKKWLFTLETENDLIVVCRLMNIFRRKGIRLLTLAMASVPEGYGLMAVVETPEAEVEHIFNFLRRTEGVQHVAYYRHQPAQPASFVFVDAEAESLEAEPWAELFPGSRLIFASHGKVLLEFPASSTPLPMASGLDRPEVLALSCVKTTHNRAAMPPTPAPQ